MNKKLAHFTRSVIVAVGHEGGRGRGSESGSGSGRKLGGERKAHSRSSAIFDPPAFLPYEGYLSAQKHYLYFME